MSITAFPVLARILTELKLLRVDVGIQTISAAAVDDVVAWCLLALVVSFIHAGSDTLLALWIFLTALGYAAFAMTFMRWGLLRMIEYTESSHSDSISEAAVGRRWVGEWGVVRLQVKGGDRRCA